MRNTRKKKRSPKKTFAQIHYEALLQHEREYWIRRFMSIQQNKLIEAMRAVS